MQTMTPLEPGEYFHIYNRGVDRSNIFFEDRNFAYFLRLYARHVSPVAQTYAYCLLPNHFHFLVRIRRERPQPDRPGFQNRVGLADESTPEKLDRRAVSQAFNHWLAAYAKAINKGYERSGGLFQRHFGRIAVDSERYFAALVHYIHYNPQRHGLVPDFRDWRHSSYATLLSDRPTRLERATVLEWFGGREGFRRFHLGGLEEATIAGLVGED